MSKKMLLILIAGVAAIFVATGIYAGTTAPDV
ncbi:MAG: cytochrome C, partial [Deltaproteobacteria bacterium]|nr:cytochrome C [Deltaproteobacteria bacterium]